MRASGAQPGANLPLIAIRSAVPELPVVEQRLRVARPCTRSPMLERHIPDVVRAQGSLLDCLVDGRARNAGELGRLR